MSGLLAYSVKVILCARAASGQTPQLSRAREITEQLYEIIGPGNSVILTDSGHRVDLGRT